MYKKILLFVLLIVIVSLTGCMPPAFVNSKSIMIVSISLDEEEKGIQALLYTDFKTLNISKANIIAYGIVYKMGKVEDASAITLQTNDGFVEKPELDYGNVSLIIAAIDASNYTTPYSIRGYIRYLDGKEQEKVVYANTYREVILYDLAKEGVSAFAQEIKTKVEGVEITSVEISLNLYDFSVSTTSEAYEVQMTDEGETIKIAIDCHEGYHFGTNVTVLANGEKVNETDYVVTPQQINYTFEDRRPEPDDYVTVSVIFDLASGYWNSEVFTRLPPEHLLNVTSKNDASGASFTLINSVSLEQTYRWFHKIFIRYDELVKAYRIVAVDNATAGIFDLNLPDYDFVLAVHNNCMDINARSVINSYTSSNDTIGMYVVFDSNPQVYQTGKLSASFYSSSVITNPMEEYFNEAAQLPVPYRSGFRFTGWSDGNTVFSEFPRYQYFQHVTSITYTALWESCTGEDFDSDMRTLIPEVINHDLLLPKTYGDYTVSWNSSNEDIISAEGTYHKPFEQSFVTLTATLSLSNNETAMFSYDLVANGYKPLTPGIASGYICRSFPAVTETLFDTLDIINCGFIKVNPDATLSGDTVLRNVGNFILPKAHEHGDYVIMTISTSETGWADIARSPELINKLAVNIVQMINDYGFDGVDIDWECPTLEEKANFTSMMSVIYAKVKANNPHHLVTAAIGGGRWQAPLYDLENSQYYLDYINMMTYSMGFSGGNYQNALYPRTTFHNDIFKAGKTLSYCSIDDSVAFFQNNYHIPGEKIIVGLAFYGMKQVSSGDSNWSKAGSIFYHDIVKDYLNNSLYQEYYDEVSCVPYLVSSDGTVFISYDNQISVKAKCQYVLDKGLGGVMYWENGTDLTGTLLSAVKEGLSK